MQFFEIAFRHTSRAKHSVRTGRNRVEIEFLFGCVQQIDGAGQIVSRVFDFLNVNLARWPVIYFPMLCFEFFAGAF